MRRIQRRKRPLDYLLPFLIFISIGVIAVLGFQLFMNFGNQGKTDVYFYVAEGKAKLLPYGSTDWDNAFSGTKLLLGDSLKTSFGSKVVLQFFNDTVIRMAEDTAITLTDVIKSSDKESIVLNLDNGKVWVNGQKSAGVREAEYEVRTKNLKVMATGTVFEVESDSEQLVRVFDGDVKVDILVDNEGQERVADTVLVGVGQQLLLDDASISAFEDNKNPSVLNAIDDDFKTTNYYKWNISEDDSPTDFANASESTYEEAPLGHFESEEDRLTDDIDLDEEDMTDEDTASDDEEEVDVDNNIVKKPEIIEPTDTVTTTGKLTIKGTVGSNVTKVVVESEVGGNTDSYTLSQFQKGDSVWSYNVSETFGNIAEGNNTYLVYAYDEDDNKSSPATILISYDKDGISDDDEDQEISIEEDFEAPSVVSYNGASSPTVNTDTVTVKGEVAGAKNVVVNGYTLSKFNPGDISWTYIASESLGNLELGENNFTVYATDEDGNKSDVTEFTITYNKSGADTGGDNEESASESVTADTEDTEDGAADFDSTETDTNEQSSINEEDMVDEADVVYGF